MNTVYIDQSKKKYSKSQFIKYFEAKVMRTIRKYDMLGKDKIIVAISGGKDSLTTAHILNKILSKQGRILEAILIDEGIEGYRKPTIEDAKRFCKKESIKLHIISTKKEFKFGVDEALKKLRINPCTICGTMRRYLLNKYARKLKADKIATGHNLDDEAQTIMMNQYKGNIQLSAKLGPVTGAIENKKFIKRIKPLYFVTEKEVTIYTTLKNFGVSYNECPNSKDNFRSLVRDQLNELENRYPGVKSGIINSFLEQLPSLRNAPKNKIVECKSCREPSSRQVCSMCELLEKYRK
ncbi:MAG: TIGR00269 family protein [Nanoarchaeota archaeon]|nr:TIGR00269 family protein [Nanoarchaeota archaeon]